MVKRGRAGRKRRQGQRDAKGRLKAAPERGWANMSVVLAKRCANRGMKPTDDNLRKMRDAREGYVLGRLLNDKIVTDGQHDAGLRFQELHHRWSVTSEMPRITPPAGSYGLTVPGRVSWGPKTARVAQEAYSAAQGVLGKSGMVAEWEVRRVCLEDAEPKSAPMLILGLDSLCRHFR